VSSSEAARLRSRRQVTQVAGLSVGLLVVENALGIYVNLFVSLALPSSIANVFPVLFSNTVLIAHGVVAALLIAASAILIVLTGRTGDPSLRYLAIAALLVLALTSYLGYHFVATQENLYSFGMEMGFLAVLLLQMAVLARVATRGSAGNGPAPSPAAPA
jgi:hypothetical protein